MIPAQHSTVIDQNTVFIAVDAEIVHGPLLLSGTKKVLVLGRCQMQFYIAFPEMRHTHVACTSREKSELLAFPVRHKTRKCCQLRYKKDLHAHCTQMAWIRLLLTSAGYISHDGIYNAAMMREKFPFYHGGVEALFREIYERARTIGSITKKSGVSLVNRESWQVC